MSEEKKENLVKKVCKELGVTQKELSEMFGLTTSAISQWNEEVPKVAQIALELMIENYRLKNDLNTIVKAHKILDEYSIKII